MDIGSYKAPRREVPLAKGQSFHVKGLTLTDISVLVETHFDDLDAIMDLLGKEKVNLTLDNLKPLATSVVSQAPGLAANLIALGAGQPDAAPNIQAEFTVGIQIRALMDIGDLTFAEVGGVKKGLEQVAALLAEKRKTLTKAPVKKRAG